MVCPVQPIIYFTVDRSGERQERQLRLIRNLDFLFISFFHLVFWFESWIYNNLQSLWLHPLPREMSPHVLVITRLLLLSLCLLVTLLLLIRIPSSIHQKGGKRKSLFTFESKTNHIVVAVLPSNSSSNFWLFRFYTHRTKAMKTISRQKSSVSTHSTRCIIITKYLP